MGFPRKPIGAARQPRAQSHSVSGLGGEREFTRVVQWYPSGAPIPAIELESWKLEFSGCFQGPSRKGARTVTIT